MWINRQSIRIFLWLTLGVYTFILLWLGVAPLGYASYTYDFTKPCYFINKLTPLERVEAPADGTQKIIGDPVYFSLRTQRTFDKARVTITYENQGHFPIIAAGVLADKKVWRYQTATLDNLLLNQLSNSWVTDRLNDLVLYQRKKKYDSIGDFLKMPPNDAEVMVYDYDYPRKYSLPDYAANTEARELGHKLRGGYQFYTYIKDETLDFDFSLIDLNQNKDADPIEIKLYRNNELLKQADLNDDGIASDINKTSGIRTIGLSVPGLAEGAYKVELVANDDIITDSIKTSQQKISFINKLWIAESKATTTLFTDIQELSAQTSNPGSLSPIKLASSSLELSETYRQFSRHLNRRMNRIELSRGDITLSGEGVFSFTEAEFFEPNVLKLNGAYGTTKLNDYGVNYVLARYNQPVRQGSWQVATAEFDLKNAYREFNKYSFLLSIPGLRVEDGSGKGIVVKEIKVELNGTNLWDKLAGIWKK